MEWIDGLKIICVVVDVHFSVCLCPDVLMLFCVPGQMFERETKREKILEARHREMRLKDRSRSEQSKEDDGNMDGEESAEEMLARSEKEFFEMVGAEQKKKEKEEEEQLDKEEVGATRTFVCITNSK